MNKNAFYMGYTQGLDKRAIWGDMMAYGAGAGALGSLADAGIRLAGEKLVYGKGWKDLTPEEKKRFLRENIKTAVASGIAGGTIGGLGKLAENTIDSGNTYWDNVGNMFKDPGKTVSDATEQVIESTPVLKRGIHRIDQGIEAYNWAKNFPDKMGGFMKEWGLPIAGLGMAAIGGGMLMGNAFGGNKGGMNPQDLKNVINPKKYRNPFETPELDLSKDGPWRGGVKTYT